GLRRRNFAGCSRCRKQGLAELSGYDGRSVAAEMIDPRLLAGLLEWVRDRGRGPVPAPDRTAMDTAMVKAYSGIFDPHDIEQRFPSVETEVALRAAAKGARRVGACSCTHHGPPCASGWMPFASTVNAVDTATAYPLCWKARGVRAR